jgi:hypothetical protein
MFHRPLRIAAAVGLETRFIILQAMKKREDGGLVVRQADVTDGHIE